VTDAVLAERAKAERFRRAAQVLRERADELQDDDNRVLIEDAEEEEQNDEQLVA
jgi:hypothetical protein